MRIESPGRPVADDSGGRAASPGANAGDRAEWRLTLAVAVLVLALFGALCALRYEPLGYLIGDGPYYAEAAVSLLYDGDLDLRNQLAGGLSVHGPQVALGRDGVWYPKHPLLLPVLALPFLFVFGMPGFLIFNLLVLAGLSAAMLRLARRHAPPPAATCAVLVLLFGTFLRAYAYNLSPDLLGTLLLTLGVLAIMSSRCGLGGGLLGTAVLGKLLMVVALPFAVSFAAARAGPRGAARFAAGAALPLALLGGMNAALFGSPLVTAYDRNVMLRDGQLLATSHWSLFGGDLSAGLRGELLDPRHGLLPTAPVLLLAIPGAALLARRRLSDAVFLHGLSVFLILFLAGYRDWAASHYGNRFLLPAVALSAPAVALALERGWTAVRHRRPPSRRVGLRAPA